MSKSKATPTIYHETLGQGIEWAIKTHAEYFTPDATFFDDHGFSPMSYETSQSRVIPGTKVKNGKPCGLHVYIYRMPSGRYEVTAYTTN